MSEPAQVVQLFHTCLVNEIEPDVGFAVVRVLERIGFTVNVPLDQTCCGQPAFNGGYADEARRIARHTIAVLHQTEGPIVIPSGSCGDMITHQYDRLFDDDAVMRRRAHDVAARCWEFSRFVVAHAPQPLRGRLLARVAYHPSCHLLRGLGVSREPLALIDGVDGATSVAFRDQDECCGFGGLFSIKNPEISGAMLDRKLTAIEASGADRVVSCDLGCLLQIGGGLHRRGSPIRTQHLATFLEEALS
jgi:L-lactate dehydrogenase complex protein LldE